MAFQTILLLPDGELERIENLLVEALRRPASYWRERGVVPPWHAHETDGRNLMISLKERSLGNARRFREPVLDMLTMEGSGREKAERQLLEKHLFEIFPNLRQKLAADSKPPDLPGAFDPEVHRQGVETQLQAALRSAA